MAAADAPPLDQLGRRFHLPPPAALPAPAGRAIAGVLLSGMRRRFQAGVDPLGRPWPRLRHPRPAGGDKPLLNFGILRNSYRTRVHPDGAEMFSDLPQARLQNFGGTVTPKRAKALAIPLTPQAARAGGPRRFPKELALRPLPPGKNAVGVLYERAAGGRTVDHYLLVKKVTVPARLHIGASAEDLATITNIVSEYGYSLLPQAGVTRAT